MFTQKGRLNSLTTIGKVFLLPAMQDKVTLTFSNRCRIQAFYLSHYPHYACIINQVLI